jgi:hypothetical protein
VILEKKELNIKYLELFEGYFSDENPSEYVEGFKYYAVEQKIHRDFRIKK